MKHPTGDDHTGLALCRRAAAWAGHSLPSGAEDGLRRFAHWLVAEAVPAGGLGPAEGDRLWGRHLAESLAMAVGWSDPPPALTDLGGGVGLPAIPLALLFPVTRVTLIDRSGRRCRLARRAGRVVGAANLEVVQARIEDLEPPLPALTWRAVLSPEAALGQAARLLGPSGRSVLAFDRGRTGPIDLTAPPGLQLTTAELPTGVLDGPVRFLIMTAT